MIGHFFGSLRYLLCGDRFHSRHVLRGSQLHAAKGGGGIVPFNGTGRIVGGPEGGQHRFLGGFQLAFRNFALLAGIQLAEDFSLLAGTRQEDTLHEALWRSDGTVDQLYLSLRLAVAEALLPKGPLVLDDALVRFDDKRLKAAMAILKDEAKARQVILFTCHDRESKLV